MTSRAGDGRADWLRPPLVCLVTDGRREPDDLIERVTAAVAGGVRLVQLREPQRPAGELLALAVRLRERLAGRAALLVNDRLDVALAAGAEGAHLPTTGLPPRAARVLASHLLVGRSVHAADEAAAVAGQGVDYLLLGTIFASGSHPGTPPAGLGLVRETRERVALPLLAIGGMTADNAADVVTAGADGVAAISALLAVADPRRAAERMLAAVQAGWGARDTTAVGTARCN